MVRSSRGKSRSASCPRKPRRRNALRSGAGCGIKARGRGRYPVKRRRRLRDVPFPTTVPRSMKDTHFQTYIRKVLRRVKPTVNINRESVQMMDTLVKDALHTIACQASSKMGKKKTLKPKFLTRGMKKVMPKSLVDKADAHAQMVLERFQNRRRRR